MGYRDEYSRWLNNEYVDEATKKELLELEGNETEIEDRFYKSLSFGTAGLRGKLGAGTNRMNYYNIGKATQGIADYIISKGREYCERGVAIAYDSRHYSPEFATYSAEVLAANGIKSFLYSSLRATPQLSYTIRELGTASGINITASHNPKEYNGYKVYWEDGAQVMEDIADAMTLKINAVDMFGGVKRMDIDEAKAKGLVTILGKEMDDKYIQMVKSLSIYPEEELDKSAIIVYTPLNGAGSVPVQRILSEQGFKNIHVVKEQADPDPDFTTVGYPNPEDSKAFKLSEELGKKVGATLLIATDPDSDRLAIEVIDDKGEYVPFNGNQIGAILIKYIVEGLYNTGKLPKKAAIVKSIVTGELGASIAADYGVKTYESLTGFKNICGMIPKINADDYSYIFGYEESIGYNIGDKVWDKDAVSSAMMLCEAAAYYKKQGKTLIDVLYELYDKYGYYRETQVSLELEGVEGAGRIARMMKGYRENYVRDYDGIGIVEVADYLGGYEGIPSSDVLKFKLSDGSWYALRPSGTEPKIKLYLYAKADTNEKALDTLDMMKELIMSNLNLIK